MGLVEFLRQWQRGRLAVGVAVSILLHVALILLAVGVRLPGTRFDVKRGEPLIVELPKGDDSPPPGAGGAAPSAPAPRAQARPSAPAPKVAAAPAPRAAEPARRPPAPRPEPAPPRQVASTPVAPPAADTGSMPAPQPAPAQPAPPQPAPSKPDAPSPPAESAPAESAPQPLAQRQTAALPPQPPGRSAPDTLSALRRGSGGGGGRGEGHSGIEGEPIALDSKDPRYSDYLDRVRRAIKEKWGFPCVKNVATHECEYKTTHLIIEFGIAKDGTVPFVNVVRPSGYPIYDDYAVNAVKLAAPFPPIPDNFSKTGVPIHATFSYVVESSLANILR